MTKKDLGTRALEKRLSLSKADYWNFNDQILEGIKQFNWADHHYVHIFLPIREKNEVDTFEILSFFKHEFPDLKIVVPRTHFADLSMSPVLFDHELTVLVKNKHHIPEPLYGKMVPVNLIDVILVPLLTFDRKGHRVGYGAGFYDRFLKNCKPDALKIGLSFFPPESEDLDVHEFDVKLSHCITPQKTYIF